MERDPVSGKFEAEKQDLSVEITSDCRPLGELSSSVNTAALFACWLL